MSIRCCCPRSSDCLPRGRYAAINCLPSCAAMPTSSITPGSTGQRSFGTDTRGTIYFDNTGATMTAANMSSASVLQ